jgi:DNA-binding transcriptional ArsR family regulator
MNTEQAKARADVLKAVAHPTRVLILHALHQRDHCVNELRSLAACTLPTLSRHLDRLKRAGIVTERRAGPKVIHHLACPCILTAVDCTLDVIQSTRKRQSRIDGP